MPCVTQDVRSATLDMGAVEGTHHVWAPGTPQANRVRPGQSCAVNSNNADAILNPHACISTKAINNIFRMLSVGLSRRTQQKTVTSQGIVPVHRLFSWYLWAKPLPPAPRLFTFTASSRSAPDTQPQHRQSALRKHSTAQCLLQHVSWLAFAFPPALFGGKGIS